jgi:hypothetical protein
MFAADGDGGHGTAVERAADALVDVFPGASL